MADSVRVDSAYVTIWSLPKVDLTEHGFLDNEVDLEIKQTLTSSPIHVEPTVDIGREVSARYGCVACHAVGDDAPVPQAAGPDGSQVAVGPAWTGLWKSRREFTDGSFIKSVDETYLRESILDPGRRVATGFETEKTGVGMPSYLGVLRDHEIDSIILYIKSLQKQKKK